MKVTVIGSGGREHALAWKLAQSPLCEALWAEAPVADAEPGVYTLPPVQGPEELAQFCRDHGMDLVVIGPEAPLAAGWADVLRERGVTVFGPSARGAQLESSKWFAKKFMQCNGIPTADFTVCESLSQVERELEHFPIVPVLKYDGLASGKGVAVPNTREEALSFARKIFEKGESTHLLLEERLFGEEVSLLAITDGTTVVILPPTRDHKRLHEGDKGPNTGGMGAFTPVDGCDFAWVKQIEELVFTPFLRGIHAEGIDYRGVIYAGLMLTNAGPRVLEFNCRLGDPETQPLMCAIEDDLLPLFFSAARGKLVHRTFSTRAALCVVLASEGYPAAAQTGVSIEGLQEAAAMENVKIFHAGTRRVNHGFVTRGGRVLGVTGVGDTLKDASRAAYCAAEKIHFTGMHMRRDIGKFNNV